MNASTRRRQTETELDRLHADVQRWIEHRRRSDRFSQYRSQLDALATFLNGAAQGLETAIRNLHLQRSPAEIYEDCWLYDLRIVWLRRVWQFFREKFDQRDDPELGPMLQAADEIVWSCYSQVFERAQAWGLSVDQGPTPLPFVEAQYSPEAFPSQLVPRSLKVDVDVGFLSDHLNRLPIPVVRIQPACVRAPWWLVLLGHEVGHHVQYDLGLVDAFRDKVVAAVAAAGGEADDLERWGRWSGEIFADVCSVLFMGTWAPRAMVELELRRPDGMLKRRTSYPASAVRLLLLARTASDLGLGDPCLPADPDLTSLVATSPDAHRDASFVTPVVETARSFETRGIPSSLETLLSMQRHHYEDGGIVDQWSSELLGDADPQLDRSLRGARLAASASLKAWWKVMDEVGVGDAERLAQRCLALIAGSREEGTRASLVPAIDESDAWAAGLEVANQLIATGHNDLVPA